MKTIKTTLAMVLGAFTLTTLTTFAAGPDWPPAPWTRIANRPQADDCCKAGGKVAIACTDCKTINETGDAEKAAGFFKKDATHDCAGCKGKVTVKQLGGGKGPVDVKTTHVCSKCGPTSAMTCATHVKGAK
jgi:hypothetical protein